TVPLDPYLLGVWLGDGSHKESGITCHIDDYSHYCERIVKAGFGFSKNRLDKRSEVTGYFNINNGFKAKLKEIGVYGNKHIPNE
ncbi:hypothetical protein, partial [Escherichia coli]|uniref:hypothetical protein n=1 Tax=Escherichia coli TaxID=562 RepID=UPI001962A97B